MNENQEFIDEYYNRVESTLEIPTLARAINEQKSKIKDIVTKTATIIRGVTADMTPSERFVSDKIDLLPVKISTRQKRMENNGNPSYEEVTYTVRTALVLNHKGFNSLKVSDDKEGYTYDSTYANPVGHKLMLNGIADNTKMMTLLRELIDKNKKKASQRCMDLMKISSEAKELLEFGEKYQARTIRTKLVNPVEIEYIILNSNYNTGGIDMKKGLLLVEEINLLERGQITLVGRDINGNSNDKTISPSNLEDYNIFMQLITPLKDALKNMGVELEAEMREVNVIAEAVNTKLASYLVLFKLDKTLLDKMGNVEWRGPYNY